MQYTDTIRRKARAIGQRSYKNIDTDAQSWKDISKILNRIANGDGNSFTDLFSGQNIVSKIYSAINEMIYEPVAFAAVASGFNNYKGAMDDLFKKGFGKVVGAEIDVEKYFYSDFILFFQGDVKIGFDVKANREMYSHTYSAKGDMSKMIVEGIRGQIPGNILNMKSSSGTIDEYLGYFAYALTNLVTLKALHKEGRLPENSKKYNAGIVKQYAMNSLQSVALLTSTVYFIDNYIKQVLSQSTEHDQIIVLLGDNMMFLREMI